MRPTLLILAAGMASRYGSMKQIQGFGPSGETIMDYSIYDAIRAGFTKVVFIIRKDFADDFKAIIGKLAFRLRRKSRAKTVVRRFFRCFWQAPLWRWSFEQSATSRRPGDASVESRVTT